MTENGRMIETRIGSLAVRGKGDGPPAVLWHSLFVDDRSWHRVEDELARDRRLVIITGPGHGSSPDPGRRYSMDLCAAAAGDVLTSFGVIEPVDWVGNAWGGHVGVIFAATWPERCRTLVTLGTPIQSYSLSERLETQVLVMAYRLLGPVDFIVNGVRDVLLSPTTRAKDPEAVALVVDCLRSFDRAALTNAVVSISLQRPDLIPRLSHVACPTLFVTGGDHMGWTAEQASTASGLLANGSVAVVPTASYLIPFEAPDQTVRLIRDFWGGDFKTFAPATSRHE